MRRISCLCLAATSAALVVAGLAAGGTAARSGCTNDFVTARIAGRTFCLQRGMACRSRLNRGFHRYLFDCRHGYLVYWWRGLLARPLHIPTLAAGSPCPATEQNGTLGERGNVDVPDAPAFGPGPAYPGLASNRGQAELTYLAGWGPQGWDGTKLLWTVPKYVGPYLVRGRQLDGPGELAFDWAPWTDMPRPDMRLTGPYGSLHPAATFLHAPGCYAYQVDGRGFSYLVVFEARLVS